MLIQCGEVGAEPGAELWLGLLYLRASGCARDDRLPTPRAYLIEAPSDMRWLAPRAAVPTSIGGPADQPAPSAMIA